MEIRNLPNEILVEIFLYLDLEDWRSFDLTCRRFHKMRKSLPQDMKRFQIHYLHSPLFSRAFPLITPLSFEDLIPPKCRNLFTFGENVDDSFRDYQTIIFPNIIYRAWLLKKKIDVHLALNILHDVAGQIIEKTIYTALQRGLLSHDLDCPFQVLEEDLWKHYLFTSRADVDYFD